MKKALSVIFVLLLFFSGCANVSSSSSDRITSSNIFGDSVIAEISEHSVPSELSEISSSEKSDVPDFVNEDGEYFIGNKNTKKLHLPSCSYLPNTYNRVYFENYSEAIDEGYDPCKKCHPEW